MTDHVFKKFSNHFKYIQALSEKDAAFREMCADYEEMCTWLDNYCHSQGRPSEECDRARQLIRDLEDEIDQVLSREGL